MALLKCSKCGEGKPEDRFSKNTKNVNRAFRESWCRACKNVYAKTWRIKNLDRVKKYSTQYRKNNPGLGAFYSMGVTFAEKVKVFKQQGKRCAICKTTSHGTTHGKSPDNAVQSWCADHDHKTGKFRGVLCQRCNHVLGRVDDSIEILEKCILYLKNNKSISGER